MQGILLLLLLISPALSVEYKVSIKTGETDYAASYAIFYYTVVGTKGTTAEHLADIPDYIDRQNGTTDTW